MSLSFQEMQLILKELQDQLIGHKLIAAYDLEYRKFLLDFGSRQVFLSFQDPYLRFHLTKRKSMKVQTPMAKGLNNFLKNAVLQSLTILNEDRVLQWEFLTPCRTTLSLIMEFIPKKPNFFLTNKALEILVSLNQVDKKNYERQEAKVQPTSETFTKVDSAAIERRYHELEAFDAFLKQKKQVKACTEAEIKRLLKRLKGAEESYRQCLKWEDVQHEALLLQSNFHRLKKGLESVSVEDWEKQGEILQLHLNPLKTPQENIEERFKKSKKLKTGVEYSLKEIQTSKKKLADAEGKLIQVEKASSPKDLNLFLSHEKPKLKVDVKPVPYREYISEAGIKIWVGKSAHDNDKLTFSYSKGSDWWLHVAGVPGSHVLIKVPKDKEPDRETLLDAIQCAIFYSKAKALSHAEICVTQKKFVSRFGKGQAGKVQISHHRLVQAVNDPERFKRLKNSSELKN